MADLGGHAVPDEDDALKALGMTMGDETIQKAEDRTPLVCDPSGTLNLDQASPYGMIMEEDDEEALRGFLAEECGTQDKGLADRFIADWQSGHYRSAVLALRDAGVDFTLDPRLDIRSWSDEPLEQGLEASGLDGARARVEQAMRLIEQAGECLRSADAIALDIDPHYLAAAFTGKTVSLCDQLEQATKQTAAEVEEMRRQEPSVESSDGNDDSTAFFQDFLEGKKIVGLSM